MSEKERLIELINKGEQSMLGKSVGGIKGRREALADYLLENGVIVPPVKIGDAVYRISFTRGIRMKYVQETTISRIAIDNDGLWLFCSCNPTR